MAPIAVGNVIPDGTLSYFDDKDDLQSVSVHSLAAGKKVILFGVPGAFTPTCSLKHVPGFIERAEELKSKGVDDILLVSEDHIQLSPYLSYVSAALVGFAATVGSIHLIFYKPY